jgi:hypothetical protein
VHAFATSQELTDYFDSLNIKGSHQKQENKTILHDIFLQLSFQGEHDNDVAHQAQQHVQCLRPSSTL